ncbi:MAG: tRNA dihydrouridine synthase DusB [Desulfatirhabdiaceae bacterium]
MNIGPILLSCPTIMAPLAGITDLPFRLMAKRAGCGMVCSEMISANGLIYGSAKTRKMLDTAPEEFPLSIQLFGTDPDLMARAAVMAAESGAAILDINLGCSVKKVIKTGAGAALLKEPQKARLLLDAIRKAITIPLTLKIRSGWNSSGDQAITIAKIAQDVGVDAIAVHPRTAVQGFRGKADWAIIAAVKQAVHIPVIGNGDIISTASALQMMTETGCDGVMVGRHAIGNPWIFSQIRDARDNIPVQPVDMTARIDMMLSYLHESVLYWGEALACRMMRSRLGWFVHGLPHSAGFRESIRHLESETEARDRIMDYMQLKGSYYA